MWITGKMDIRHESLSVVSGILHKQINNVSGALMHGTEANPFGPSVEIQT